MRHLVQRNPSRNRPAKPETIERISNPTMKSPAVRLGNKPVIHGCHVARAWSSNRIAANSKTKERYVSEISIAAQRKARHDTKTEVRPMAEAMEVMRRRTKS